QMSPPCAGEPPGRAESQGAQARMQNVLGEALRRPPARLVRECAGGGVVEGEDLPCGHDARVVVAAERSEPRHEAARRRIEASLPGRNGSQVREPYVVGGDGEIAAPQHAP